MIAREAHRAMMAPAGPAGVDPRPRRPATRPAATTVAAVSETIVPIFRVADARAAGWYERLGFTVVHEHRFAPDLPRYLILRRGDDVSLHLSEHTGDAVPGTLAYVHVDDVDAVSAEFGVPVATQPWAREVELTDPDGNRLRVGQVPA